MRITIIVSTAFLIVAVAIIPRAVSGQERQNLSEDPAEQYVPKVIVAARVGYGEGEFGIESILMEGTIGPNALAVDKKGDIYVLDPVNTRVLKFGRDGKYLEDIRLEQKKIKIRSKNPERLLAGKNPKWFQEIYKKNLKIFQNITREKLMLYFGAILPRCEFLQKGTYFLEPVPLNILSVML